MDNIHVGNEARVMQGWASPYLPTRRHGATGINLKMTYFSPQVQSVLKERDSPNMIKYYAVEFWSEKTDCTC